MTLGMPRAHPPPTTATRGFEYLRSALENLQNWVLEGEEGVRVTRVYSRRFSGCGFSSWHHPRAIYGAKVE